MDLKPCSDYEMLWLIRGWTGSNAESVFRRNRVPEAKISRNHCLFKAFSRSTRDNSDRWNTKTPAQGRLKVLHKAAGPFIPVLVVWDCSRPLADPVSTVDLIAFLQALPEDRKRRGVRCTQWLLLLDGFWSITEGQAPLGHDIEGLLALVGRREPAQGLNSA
jgi:hypothetical protein